MTEPQMKKRILVVDDEPDTRKALETMLSRAGFDVDTASTGQEAMDKAQAHSFQLVLLDIHLPHMSGLDVFRHLKTINPMAKICIMTGWPKGIDAEKDDYFSLTREGAIDKMLRKPFSREEALNAVRELLEG